MITKKRPPKRSHAIIPDPYLAFFEWCDNNGFQDVGSGPTEGMSPQRFDAAIVAYATFRDKKDKP